MSDQKIAISGEQLQKMFDAVKDSIDASMSDKVGGIVIDIQTLKAQQSAGVSQKKLDEMSEGINAKIKEMGDQFHEFVEAAKKNQPIIDAFVASEGKRKVDTKKDFTSAWQDAVNENVFGKSEKEVMKMMNDGTKMKMQLKANMTISSDLLGTGAVNTYNDRAGIVPAQRINFRDLLPTVSSPTGAYVTYKETNSLQSLTTQTEGNAKTQVEYQFTGAVASSKYISGFVRFSKQLMYAAPFMNNTLPRLLLRDFYKKENDYLFTTIAGNSTGTYVGSGTVDAEELINTIASQLKANFNASFGLIDFAQWSRLLVTKPNDYSIPGGFVIDQGGNIIVAGTPIIPASWAQTDHVLVLDRDFYERAETEGLSVQFSLEDNDNFEKNLITARVECFEEINRLRDDASIYHDFGNS